MEAIFDVIIGGYGPVGQILALLLGQKGYHVGVFERWSSLSSCLSLPGRAWVPGCETP